MSWPSCSQTEDAVLYSNTRAWPESTPFAPSLPNAPTATLFASADKDTERPEKSREASPSMSWPSCLQAGGVSDGTELGDADKLGSAEGLLEGDALGDELGTSEGETDGDELGFSDGDELGAPEGTADGDALGTSEGDALGTSEGDTLGDTLGTADSLGDKLGDALGTDEGLGVGQDVMGLSQHASSVG